MRSRGDVRRAAEWLLRLSLLAGLAIALWRSLHEERAARVVLRTRTRDLAPALARVTRSSSSRGIVVTIDSLPGPVDRAWLVGLRRAGADVAWEGAPVTAAVAVERAREPDARVRIMVAGDSGTVALADSAGVLDTMRMVRGGSTLDVASAVGWVRAAAGRFAATTPVPEASAPRAVLVLGRAGWEGKFVATALQEAGWTVRSRQPAAPGVVIADVGLLPIDTLRYAAVVALDSTAGDLAPAVARFVAQGGGLVLAGDAPSVASFGGISPARTTSRQAGRVLFDADTVTLGDLPFRPFGAVRGDAVRVERGAAAPRTVVRRAGAGRVLTTGWEDTWRWRMLGGATGLAAHREWWSRAVGLVAPYPAAGRTTGGDAAPVASLVGALGPAVHAAPAGAAALSRVALPLLLLVLLVVLLLAETASRRFRGAS